MARNGFGELNDHNRDGVDDDIDRKPGNSSESRTYTRKFDPRNEQEFSNLLEAPDQIEARRIEAEIKQDEENARQALEDAQSDVHYFPSVGKFIIPKQNTWAAHAELVKNDATNLHFNPDKFAYFDKIIFTKLKNPGALVDPTHPDFAAYDGLRTNLEVLRNDIIGIYLNDGSFDPGDEKYVSKIAGIAAAIGDALAGDTWLKRPFTRSLSQDVANVEGVGAREIYNHLLDIQEKPGLLHPLFHNLRTLIGFPDHDWNLPPLSETPYSAENLAAPLPKPEICFPIDAVPGGPSAASSLSQPTKNSAVEEARIILRWLRNLQFGDKDVEEWLDQGTPAGQTAKVEALARLVDIFETLFKKASNSPLITDASVQDANEAAGALALALAERSLDKLPPGDPQAAALERMINNLPEQSEARLSQSTEHLLDIMETGLERLTGKAVSDKSPAERLLAFDNRIQAAAYKLRSVDTLDPPEREESIELAREILRKLKNLSFSDKPLAESLDAGRPEDKAAFAQKIDEAVEAYSNLLSEAAQINPAILGDPNVKAANDAVGSFAHSVKLMAAKEIPSSVAAAQQIAADITQMPEEWKQLHDRTVGRLVKSMEGGLEKAVGDIEAAQEQQQDQDQAQEAAEAALIHSDQSRRKRRRKKRRGGSGAGTAPKSAGKRRTAHDINGDGVLDKFQGLNLTDKDMAAVKAAGGSLRDIAKQLQNLPSIDDKTLAQRQTEERERQNPQNQGPRI